MASLIDFEQMLPSLSRREKAQILKWVVRELDNDFPGIDSSPGVCGGDDAPRAGIDDDRSAAYPSPGSSVASRRT